MASPEAVTLPPGAVVYDEEEEHRKLTTALLSHHDPSVRLIAHMSSRQLAMVEQISELTRAVTELKDTVTENFANELDAVTDRVEELERAAGLG
jgi:hypothetical protein